jgi:hypothetical protein
MGEAMHDFFLRQRRPADAREMLAEIAKRVPDPEKRLRVFRAAMLEDNRFLGQCIACAFKTWTNGHHGETESSADASTNSVTADK